MILPDEGYSRNASAHQIRYLRLINVMAWALVDLKVWYEKIEDTKGVISIRKSKTDRQLNGHTKKDKQRSTKHYTEN